MKLTHYILICLIVFHTNNTLTQPKYIKDRSFDNKSNIFIDVLTFPASDSINCRIDVCYRIPNDFFILTKEKENIYKATGEITIEILDYSKNSIDRKFITKEILNNSSTFDPNYYTLGIVPFSLKRGKYNIIVIVKDIQSNRQFRTEKLTIETSLSADSTTILSDIVFLTSIDSAKPITPVNVGGNVIFSQPFAAYLELFSDSKFNDSISVSFIINSVADAKTVSSVIESDKEYKILYSMALEPKEEHYFLIPDSTRKKTGILLQIPYNKLKLGDYELVISINNGAIKKAKSFKVLWLDMPKSLMNLDFAIEILEYIATAEELKKIHVTDRKKRKEAFDKFWEERDLTPETAYNEIMSEYYYRVDYAIENYSTISNQSGAKTDRGKIHILYGAPNKVERILIPASPAQEIWIYERIKKKFIFEDRERNGDFKLIFIEDV